MGIAGVSSFGADGGIGPAGSPFPIRRRGGAAFARRLAGGLCRLSALVLLGCLSGRAQPPAGTNDGRPLSAAAPRPLAPGRFGFAGIEIYKVDEGTSRLRCADVNGDGLTDIAIINNARATIDFFIQKPPAEIASSRARPVEFDNVNEIASDARFRKESFLTEKRVFDFILEDLDGDGRPDLAYAGDPKELVVVLRTATGWSETRQRFQIPEVRPSGRILAAGDLNGDGKKDLALLGAEKILICFQREGGRMAEPVELPLADKEFSVLEIADADGDGRPDLVLVGAGQIEPLRVRLQGPAGLGPEIALETASLRSFLIADATGDGRADLITIQEATGRLHVFRLQSEPVNDPVPFGHIRLFPLPGGHDAGLQNFALADIDGDGRLDVLFCHPGLAQFHLYRQSAKGDLLSAQTYPALAGGFGVCAGDLNGDGKIEVAVLSAEEKAVGVTRWDGTRLVFPKALPLEGKPSCCAMADLDGKPGVELAVATEEERGRVIRFFTAGEPLKPAGAPLVLEKVKDPPERLVFFDLNQDGRLDLLVFFPYESPRVYLNVGLPDGAPAEGGGPRLPAFKDVSDLKDFGRGLLQGAAASSFAGGDIDGNGKPEWLLAKKGFARAFRVTPANVLEAVDQFNARDPGAEIVGIACADFTGGGRPDVALLDRSRGGLWILSRRGPEPYAIAREIRLPSIRPRGLLAVDLNGDGRADLFVAGDDRFGILYAQGSDLRLRTVAQYESELKDVRLDRLAVGDLDGDKRPDIVVSEGRKHLLEILTMEGAPPAATGASPVSLIRGARFQIFEEKTHEGRGMGGGERGGRDLRNLAVADVTGDGKADLILLVHDRLLVYPQE
jgi:hypothetical protein